MHQRVKEMRIFLAKLGRRFFRRFPSKRNKYFVQRYFRKWCPDKELVTFTNEGFRMNASPRDYASFRIFFFGDYDPFMTGFIKAHVGEGATCFDIGAERGWFTLLMAKLSGPSGAVYSFEPYQPTFEKLRANIELNNFHWVHPQNTAISAENGKSSFIPPSDEIIGNNENIEFCSGVGYLSDSASTGALSVPMVTIDSFVQNIGLNRIDIMKIDVEGAEAKVLRGAKTAISKYRPVILVEYNEKTARRAGSSMKELDDILEDYGYDRYIFWGALEKLRLEKYLKDPDPVFNAFCLPRISGGAR
jgi:FkbM family methyltransferase